MSPEAFARQLVQVGRHLDAAHILEAALVTQPEDASARLVLAQILIVLKENNYRARARHHLERLVDGSATPPVLRLAVHLLIKNVYLTNGPTEKAQPLLRAHADCFTEAEIAQLEARISELDSYRGIGAARQRRSSSPPVYSAQVSNNDVALRAYIFKEFEAQVAPRDLGGPYFTFGSCFAGNVARAMKAAGFA